MSGQEGLKKTLEGVITPDPPTGDEGNKEPTPQEPPASGAGEQPGIGEEGKIGDRDAKNVIAEVTRKVGKQLGDQMQGMFDDLASKLGQPAQAPAKPAAPAAAPVPGAQIPISDYSTTDLNAALQLPTLTPQGRQVIQQELSKRQLDETVDQKLEARDRQRLVQQEAQSAAQQAVNVYPALANEESAFYKQVDAELGKRRAQFGEHPGDVFDVANRVAQQMGVEARATRAVTQTPFIAGGHNPNAPATGDRKPGRRELSDDKIDSIGSALQHVLPRGTDGKPRKFDRKRIQGHSKKYSDQEHLYSGGTGLSQEGASE